MEASGGIRNRRFATFAMPAALFCVLLAMPVRALPPRRQAKASGEMGVTEASSAPMTFRQARRTLQMAMPKEKVQFGGRRDELRLLGRVTNYRSRTQEENPVIRLSEIERVELYGNPARHEAASVDIYLIGNKMRYGDYRFHWVNLTEGQDSEKFAEALRWLVSHAAELKPDPTATERFAAQAAAWRAARVKPAMPEDAREHNVLADNAVQEKNFDKAIDEYDAALRIFPTWPEGQFNMALLCGETGDYDCAVEHMQNYLELVPDARDAQAAKDKIIIWKDKIANPQ